MTVIDELFDKSLDLQEMVILVDEFLWSLRIDEVFGNEIKLTITPSVLSASTNFITTEYGLSLEDLRFQLNTHLTSLKSVLDIFSSCQPGSYTDTADTKEGFKWMYKLYEESLVKINKWEKNDLRLKPESYKLIEAVLKNAVKLCCDVYIGFNKILECYRTDNRLTIDPNDFHDLPLPGIT
jgi:hypothetical protein